MHFDVTSYGRLETVYYQNGPRVFRIPGRMDPRNPDRVTYARMALGAWTLHITARLLPTSYGRRVRGIDPVNVARHLTYIRQGIV